MEKAIKIFDRAGYEYQVLQQPTEDVSSYVTFTPEGKPVVVRNGVPVLSSFFTDGEGKWAKLLDCRNPEKLEKNLKNPENPVIAIKDGEIICRFVSLTGILWHDAAGRKFYLVSKYEREELEADGLGYITAESDGTYENMRYIAFDGKEEVSVPRYLYNERNRKFTVGVNFKAMAYEKMRTTGSAAIAVKNAQKLVYARKAETGEYMLAHTNGAYEAGEYAKDDVWNVQYTTGVPLSPEPLVKSQREPSKSVICRGVVPKL